MIQKKKLFSQNQGRDAYSTQFTDGFEEQSTP